MLAGRSRSPRRRNRRGAQRRRAAARIPQGRRDEFCSRRVPTPRQAHRSQGCRSCVAPPACVAMSECWRGRADGPHRTFRPRLHHRYVTFECRVSVHSVIASNSACVADHGQSTLSAFDAVKHRVDLAVEPALSRGITYAPSSPPSARPGRRSRGVNDPHQRLSGLAMMKSSAGSLVASRDRSVMASWISTVLVIAMDQGELVHGD